MKLKRDTIGVETLQEYLADASDFAFELRTLEMLTARGIQCEHGGQYTDPDTKKFREFDLRARVTKGRITLAAAIECKSIGQHFPLLVSCVPRKEAEAYHQVFIHEEERDEEPHGFPHIPRIKLPEGKEGQSISPSSLYPAGAPVGKTTVQVGRRDTRDAELHANDSEFFEKWSQALQSLDDLVCEIASREFIESRWDGENHVGVALPIVVVPDATLWAVHYAVDGRMEGPPALMDRVSIYIGRSYWNPFPGDAIEISHLEVMTEQGLVDFCNTYLADEDSMKLFLQQGR